MEGLGRRAKYPARPAAAIVAATAGLAAVMLVLLSGSHQALGRVSSVESLPLSRGAAWYSETLDTSPATVANGRQKPERVLFQKWITWKGYEFQRTISPSGPADPGAYVIGDSEPGFGDWDALDVHTLPGTAVGVLRLLRSGRLEEGQTDRAERKSPLIWLAQLAAMLADDPNTETARAAAFKAIAGFPGLLHLGPTRDPKGRLGEAVAERASNLHPLLVAAGKGCHSPLGGPGCVSVATPAGRYELQMFFDPTQNRVLGVRTIALDAIPAAWIKAGSTIYEVSYLQGKVIARPHIPPIPKPTPPSVESVPWYLVRASGRQVIVNWESGTCDPRLPPNASLKVAETSSTVTFTVSVHVVKAGGGLACAGVGLGGTLAATLTRPVGDRKILHGRVTDRDR
jgi:hypothetical protein